MNAIVCFAVGFLLLCVGIVGAVKSADDDDAAWWVYFICIILAIVMFIVALTV